MLLLNNTTRTSAAPSTGPLCALAIDGGMADTACYVLIHSLLLHAGEGDPEEDHRDQDAPFIKDALKATGRGL